MAAITDLITQATNGSRPSPTTLSATHTVGGTTLTCTALTGWPTASAVHFITYTIDTSGNKVAGTQVDWKGVVSGNTVTGCVVKAGSDQNYSIGAIVEAAPTAAWADDLYSWGTQDHDVQGRHSQLTDTNGKKVLGFTLAGSGAANDVTVGNATTGNNPTLTAEGTDSNIGLSIRSKGTGVSDVDGAAPQKYVASGYNFVESGCVWTADAPASTRNASMTAGAVWINGIRLSIALVTARAFTASKDTYVDVLISGFLGTVVYTEVTNNAASPALAANSIRIGIVVTGATNIANAGSINQGDPTAVLPIASSIAYSVTDSLGNLICNRNSNPVMIGYRQAITTQNVSATGTGIALTGLNCPVIIVAGQRIKLSAFCKSISDTNIALNFFVYETSVAGTLITQANVTGAFAGSLQVPLNPSIVIAPSAGTHTYIAAGAVGSGNADFTAASNGPMYLMVELV